MGESRQATLRQLLKDPVYKEWFKKEPKLKATPAKSAPYYLYVQREAGGPWKRRECASYREAYKLVASNIRKFHDMAIVSKRQAFQPPVVKTGTNPRTGRAIRKYKVPSIDPDMPRHRWCPYCRRPTIFTWFTKHHAFTSFTPTAYEKRCMICGVREVFIRKYQ